MEITRRWEWWWDVPVPHADPFLRVPVCFCRRSGAVKAFPPVCVHWMPAQQPLLICAGICIPSLSGILHILGVGDRKWVGGGGRKWAPFSSFPKEGLGETLKLHLQEPFSWASSLTLFSSETPGSLHCPSDPASDPWGVTGLWDRRGAVARKGRDFSPPESPEGKETLRPSLLKITLLGFPCSGFSIPGYIFCARWILSRHQMTTVKKS